MSGWNPFGEDNFSKLTEEELIDREFDMLRASKCPLHWSSVMQLFFSVKFTFLFFYPQKSQRRELPVWKRTGCSPPPLPSPSHQRTCLVQSPSWPAQASLRGVSTMRTQHCGATCLSLPPSLPPLPPTSLYPSVPPTDPPRGQWEPMMRERISVSWLVLFCEEISCWNVYPLQPEDVRDSEWRAVTFPISQMSRFLICGVSVMQYFISVPYWAKTALSM